MAPETTKVLPLTCHGHSRPVTHISFSEVTDDDQYYLISACKDNNPMLRDGTTGDWIGTFIGHKGAVWQARLSADARLAATGSADFSAKVWDTHTGESLCTLQHNHIVRAVAFPAENNPRLLATGGAEKKLRVFDLEHISTTASSAANSDSQKTLSPTAASFQPNRFAAAPGASGITTSQTDPPEGREIAPGAHTATIKSIIFARSNPNILVTAADDKYLRWFDIRTRTQISSQIVDGTIGSCELSTGGNIHNNIANGNGMQRQQPVSAPFGTGPHGLLSVVAGKSIYLFDGDLASPGAPIKTIKLPYETASVAVNVAARRFVTGGGGDTWVRLWDLDVGGANSGVVEAQEELEIGKGHHGPVWSVCFSPDAKLYATGSEDGTVKLWKFTKGAYGLWR